jgi:ubiquinone/menaquinone biosynthesis C-methylase UbiE
MNKEKMHNFEDLKKRYSLRSANPTRLDALKKFGGKQILDVGCGTGSYVFKLGNEKKIEGTDYQEFDSWKEAPKLFKVANATNLPYDTGSFDTVSCFETLEHLSDPDGSLKEMYRVTRKNVILSVPNCVVPKVFLNSNLIYSHWNDPTHINFFNKKSFTELIEANGFKIEKFKFFNIVRIERMMRELLKSQSTINKIIFNKLILPGLLKKNKYYISMLVIANKVN